MEGRDGDFPHDLRQAEFYKDTHLLFLRVPPRKKISQEQR